MAAGEPRKKQDEDPRAAERARVVAAFSRAASELGYRRLEMGRVARYARLTPERCEEHFPTKEEGLIAAQDAFLDRLWAEVQGARRAAGDWPEGVRSSLGAVIAVLVEASRLARVFMVEATAASIGAAERQYDLLDRLAALLRDGRSLYPRAAGLVPATERLLIGGAASVVCEHLLAEEPAALISLEPQLVEALLAPYLGPEEARRAARAP